MMTTNSPRTGAQSLLGLLVALSGFSTSCQRSDHSVSQKKPDPAEITVEADGRRWWRLIDPGCSYRCSNDPRAHFGLGQVSQVETIHIIWPGLAIRARSWG